MKTDTEIKIEGVQILLKYFGQIETERFITLLQREPFDYTKWQRNLWLDKEVKELSKEAMAYRKNKKFQNDVF